MPDLLDEAKRLSDLLTDVGRYEPPPVSTYIEQSKRLISELVERLEQERAENTSLRVLLREEYMARLNMPAENREQDAAAVDARIEEALAAQQREKAGS